MAKPNENQYYNTLGRITGNLKDILGMGKGSAQADSNYLTNLGKVSRLKGTEMDNTKKRELLSAISKAVLGKNPDEALSRRLAHSGADMEALITGEQKRPHVVSLAEQKAQLAQREVAEADRLAGLAEKIVASGITPDIGDFDALSRFGNPNEMRGWDRAKAASEANIEDLIRKHSALKWPGGASAHKTAGQQERGVASTEQVADAKTDWYNKRTKYVGLLGEKNVKLVEERINSLKGITAAKKNQIINAVLNDVARLDQSILTDQEKRKLLKQQTDYYVQKEETEKKRGETQDEKTKTQEEITKKESTKKWIEKLKLKNLPKKLKQELTNLKELHNKALASISKIQRQEQTALSMTALNNARRMKINVEKQIARALEPYRKELLEAQAGAAQGRSLETLLYPNKHGADDDDLDEEDFSDDDDADDDATDAGATRSGSTRSFSNIPGNWAKVLDALGIGGPEELADMPEQKDPMALELSKLSNQPVANWTPDQKSRYIKHATEKLGLNPRAAASLLQRAIQGQSPRIRR